MDIDTVSGLLLALRMKYVSLRIGSRKGPSGDSVVVRGTRVGGPRTLAWLVLIWHEAGPARRVGCLAAEESEHVCWISRTKVTMEQGVENKLWDIELVPH
jgi:hypothetical protein